MSEIRWWADEEQDYGQPDRVLRLVSRLAGGAVIVLLLILVGLGIWGTARADITPPTRFLQGTTSNGTPFTLRIFTKPCTHPEIHALLIAAGFDRERIRISLARLKAGELVWDGKTYPSCWLAQDSLVYSLDSAGDWFNGKYGVPIEAFLVEGI